MGKIISDIVKVYPNMLRIVIYHNDYVLADTRSPAKKRESYSSQSATGLRKTKQRISDIIDCNQFDLWCTFTFNCKKCQPRCDNKPCICDKSTCLRYNPDMCKFRMFSWLHRQKQLNKQFAYLIVPEFHKDGALHFHAFIKHSNAKLIDTHKMSNGHKVYKFLNFTLGINDVVDIRSKSPEEHTKIANYMTKYITKDMPTFRGKKRYFCSQHLDKPTSHVNGVFKFNLHKIIRGHEPKRQTLAYEVQEHPITSFIPDGSQQSSLIDTSSLQIPVHTPSRRSKLPSAIGAHT